MAILLDPFGVVGELFGGCFGVVGVVFGARPPTHPPPSQFFVDLRQGPAGMVEITKKSHYVEHSIVIVL